MDLRGMFEAATDEFLRFNCIESPKHPRPDVCAFLMLHEAVPGTGDMITSSEHDEYFLSVDCDALVKVATPELVRDLHRCGVRYSSEYDCLSMFA